MYKLVDQQQRPFSQYHYQSEDEYERMIVAHAGEIFGRRGIYFDVKKRVGKAVKGSAIPDGYYLDLMFHDDPKLYFVEVELSNHDIYSHIGEQILRFAIASETSKHKIKTILIEEINSNQQMQQQLERFYRESKYRNINELLDKLIFDNEVSVLIVIDEETPELNTVLSKIKMPVQIIEAQSYCCGQEMIHRFSSFQDEVAADLPPDTDYDQLDTLVVPARREGFESAFLGDHQWYAVRISTAMLDKIKYLAIYQVAPVSAITYLAEVERISKYQDSNKYILYLKDDSIKKITKIPLAGKKFLAPQAPRYASLARLSRAQELAEVWE